MRKFALHIIIILSVVLCVSYILDRYYTYIFENQHPNSKLQQILQDENPDYDVIFIGNSRIECGIDCELFTELTGKTCMNYGLAGSALKEQLLVLKLLEAQNKKVEQVYVQLDFPVNKESIFPSIKAEVIPYTDNALLKEFIKSDLSFGEKYVPFYKYMTNDRIVGFREVFAMSIKKRSGINLNNGWTPKKGHNFKDISPLSKPLKITGEVKYISEIERTATSLGNVNWIIAPYCKYKKNRSMEDEFKQIFPDLTSYMSIYDDKESFYFDCGHLNVEGARIFTKQIAEDFLLKN
ncbi:MAG: hypothetical protein ACI9Y7_001990 [Dokdonia sp.]|jgi:hypothetical protein